MQKKKHVIKEALYISYHIIPKKYGIRIKRLHIHFKFKIELHSPVDPQQFSGSCCGTMTAGDSTPFLKGESAGCISNWMGFHGKIYRKYHRFPIKYTGLSRKFPYKTNPLNICFIFSRLSLFEGFVCKKGVGLNFRPYRLTCRRFTRSAAVEYVSTCICLQSCSHFLFDNLFLQCLFNHDTP